MLDELKLRMYKAKLHIPKKDYKLFSTTQFPYTPESQESSNETYMSSKDETHKQKDTNLQFQTHSTTSDQELTKHDKFEKDNETEEEEEEEEGCKRKPQDDNDNGYHTPASPASTIAPVLKCPPAPKRLKWVRYVKRKGRIGATRRRILVPDEQIISLFGCEIEAGRMCKKARRKRN